MSQQNTSLVLGKEDALVNVQAKIARLNKENGITFPKGYAPENAINSAWLMLQEVKDRNGKPALEVCTKSSITEALFDMCLQGLSPAKKQCYFIPYGNKLTLSRSYHGTVAVTKRLKGVKDVKAFVIYENDKFGMTFDKDTLTLDFDYEPKFENINNQKIKGAFAVIVGEAGDRLHTEIMTMDQIKAAWNQGQMKGNSGAHKNFTEEMAKKTVINRACKKFFNTSDDSDLLIESINRSVEGEDPERDIIEEVKAEVKEEIKEKANKEVIDVDITEVDPSEEPDF